MTGRRRVEDRGPAARAMRDRPTRPGPHVGRLRITPLRVTLAVALLGGLGFLGYSVLVRDALQVPLMATGFGIVGIVLAAVSVMAVGAVVRAGREGRDGVAVITALMGGGFAVAALLSLAVAIILGMIWSGTKSG